MPCSSDHAPSIPMLRPIARIALGAAAAAALGCTSTPDPGTGQKPADAAGAPAAEPAYPYSRKAEFTTSMKTNLDQLNRDIDQLAAKIAALSTTAQEEARQKLHALREQAQRLQQQFDRIQNASAGGLGRHQRRPVEGRCRSARGDPRCPPMAEREDRARSLMDRGDAPRPAPRR